MGPVWAPPGLIYSVICVVCVVSPAAIERKNQFSHLPLPSKISDQLLQILGVTFKTHLSLPSLFLTISVEDFISSLYHHLH